MIVAFTMVLSFDDDAMVADLAKAREESKRAFEAAGFEVKGVRIAAAPERPIEWCRVAPDPEGG